MNCFDCNIPCEYSNPLGYCYKQQSGLPHGPFEKGYQPSGIQDPIKEAALNLVDAVDRYTMGKCLRSELLIKNNELKNLLK